MEDLTTVDTSTLMDMLAQRTREYTQLLHNGAPTHEFQRYEILMVEIQTEIRSRQLPPTQEGAESPLLWEY